VSTEEADKKAAAKVRAIERSDYDAVHKDYTESMKAIGQAVQVLKKQQSAKNKESKVLLQSVISLDKMPLAAKQAIKVFLASDVNEEKLEELASGDPGSADTTRGFSSDGIVDMLEKLGDKFRDERRSLEKEETHRLHAHDMSAQSQKDSIKITKDKITRKTQTHATALQDKAKHAGELQTLSETSAQDKKDLEALKVTCKQKSVDFTKRQELRKGEIAVIKEAVSTLQSDAVSKAGARVDKPKAAGTSLGQLRSTNDRNINNQLRMAEYLNGQAKHIGSRVLSMVAVRSKTDPFKTVRDMIGKLISKLEEQSGEEMQHKQYCDKEIADNTKSRTTLTSNVESLTSAVDELGAQIQKDNTDIGELSTQISDLTKNLAKEVTFRAQAKAENEATIKDAQAGQQAIKTAIEVLQEFYVQASSGESGLDFIQVENQALRNQPSVQAGAGAGVIHMLEVVQTDFARLETDTTSGEATEAKLYQEQKQDMAVSKAKKEKALEHKKIDLQKNQQEVTVKTADLESKKVELSAADQYYETLKPSCIDSGMSFKERAARREEEIQSLQDALRILDGESP